MNLGQARERVAQSREIARAGVGQRDPRGDALDVDRALERVGKLTALRRRRDQLGNRGVSGDGRFASSQRLGEPVSEEPAPRRRRAPV